MTTTLLLGGARSGKSARALMLAEAEPGPHAFVATGEPFDAEMAERIARHRANRDRRWTTIDAPLDLPAALARARDGYGVVLVDCLTLWLSNLMLGDHDVEEATAALLAELAAPGAGALLLVSNEVGMGLVPDTPLGRAFRDAHGRLNRRVAAAADRVEFVAAGLPLVLKG